MGRSDIMAGRAYVELYTKTSQFERGLNDTRRQLRDFGGNMTALGTTMVAASAAMLVPLAGVIKKFSGFESALAALRAAANPTAKELERVREAAIGLSSGLKVGPTAIVASFTELLKAGMSVEQVLNGAGEAAVKFAKVGGLETAQAATVMADAMTVFGKTADETVNILSAAADSSSISLDQVAQSFSMASAVGGLANQNLFDLAETIAILGNNGLKGSDGGTSLKTMLMSLMSPTETGAKVFADLGLNVRDATGQMLPMRGIIVRLTEAMAGLGPVSRDAALKGLFGTDGLRAGAILLKAGAQGWDEFGQKMRDAQTVSEKYDTLNRTLGAGWEGMLAAVERLSIAVGEALAPKLQELLEWVTKTATAAMNWVEQNRSLVTTIAEVALGVGAVGAALIALGSVTGAVASSFGAVLALFNPVSLAALGVAAALTAVGAGALYLANASAAVRTLDDSMSKLRETGDQLRATQLDQAARLQQLAGAQNLSSGELQEAATIIDQLEGKYGDLGMSIDSNTGKVIANANAFELLREAMRNTALAEVDKEMKEAEQNLAKLKGQLYQATTGDDATWFGVDEREVRRIEAEVDNAMVKLKMLDRRKKDLTVDSIVDRGGGTSDPKAITGGATAGGTKKSENQNAASAAAHTAEMKKKADEEAAEAAKEAAKGQKKLDDLEADMAKKRRTRHEQELAEIKELAEARRQATIDAGKATEASINKIDTEEAEAIEKENREFAASEAKKAAARAKEAEQRDVDNKANEAENAKLKIDLDPNMSELEKELAKLAIESEQAVREAIEAGLDPDLITQQYDLRKQLLEQNGTGDAKESVATTFSGAEAAAMGWGGKAEDESVKTLAEIRELLKIQNEEVMAARREAYEAGRLR